MSSVSNTQIRLYDWYVLGTDWPLVGRERELKAADRAIAAGAGGVCLSGPAGVGRTRLAYEIATRRSTAGVPMLWLSASPGMNAVPLGPFRHLLPGGPVETAEDALWLALERELAARARNGSLVVVIDDAHHLDDLSAAFVHRLTSLRAAFVIVTVRDDVDRPEALTVMWKDGLVERLDIGALEREEAEALLRFGLAGDVERPTVQALWSHSGGNVLLLRELTLSALEDGTLTRNNDLWSWRGRGRASARLREVVATRLGRLSEAERAALEYVAVGGALPRETLRVLADDAVLDELEARGLLVAEVIDGGAIDLDVSHSAYADVLRDALSAPRLRVLRRQLVHVAARTMTDGPRDAVRLAILRLEAGEPVDPMTLRTAATAVLWNAGHLLAESLSPIARSQPVPLGSEGGVALRLARAAWEQSGDIASGADLAVTYAWLGEVDKAADVLEIIEAKATNDEELARIASARATLLFWGLGRPDDAVAVLRTAENECRSIADSVHHRELRRARAGIALNVAEPARALALSEDVIATGPDDLASARARPTIAAALAMTGRCDDALSVVDKYLPRAFEQLDTSPLIAVQLLTARNGALMRLGRVNDSRELADQCLAVALVGESIDGAAVFESWAGRARLAAGDVHGGRRHLIESEALFTERDPLGMHPWALYSIAQASVWGGDLEAAHRALADAASIRRFRRYFDGDLYLARVLIATAEFRTRDATDAIAEAVDWTAATGMPVEEAIAWHASIRLGRSETATAPLTRLAERTANPFVRLLADHAHASAAGDAAALQDVARGFEASGLLMHALEATTEARDIYSRHGDARAAHALASAIATLSTACPGAKPPWLNGATPPPELTRREREIAQLAASGLASRAIADRLVVSVRTVDSHLYRVYTKLGVRDRASLAAALNGSL